MSCSSPSIFTMNAKGYDTGDVKHFCDVECFEVFKSNLEYEEASFRSELLNDRELPHFAECAHCSTIMCDPIRGKTVSDLIDFLDEYAIDDDVAIHLFDGAGMNVNVSDGKLSIHPQYTLVRPDDWKPIAEQEHQTCSVYSSRELGDKLSKDGVPLLDLIFIGDESGFSARLVEREIYIDKISYERDN